MTDLSKIKSQLSAILAKSNEGSGATEAEAASALAFAQRLMARHQLTEADLGSDREKTPEEVAADAEYGTSKAYTQSARMSQWQGQLAMLIARVVGSVGMYRSHGQIVRTTSGAVEYDRNGKQRTGSAMIYYGPLADTRDAQELFEEWQTTLIALARLKFGGPFRGAGRSYCDGFIEALQAKQREATAKAAEAVRGAPTVTLADAQAAQEMNPDAPATQALVTVASGALQKAYKAKGQAWLQGTGVRLSKGSSGTGGQHHGAAYGAGKSDGRNASVTRNATRRLS